MATLRTKTSIRATGRSDLRPALGESMSALLQYCVDFFTACTPGKLSPEALAKEIQRFLTNYRRQLIRKGERSYVSKRTAEFLIESLQMALRRTEPVPMEHATVLEAGLQSVLSSRTALNGKADTDSIDSLEKDARQLVQRAVKRYGPQKIVIPTG